MQNLESAFQDLEKVYLDVEQTIQSKDILCLQCGRCCNFNTNGMSLYIYELEREYIRARYGKNLVLVDGKCIGQREKLCTIHEIRPLGCRTQFCKHTYETIYESAAKKICNIEKEYGIQYHYGDAFSAF